MQDMPSRGSIHIALTFDDNFWAPAFATMRSICLSTRRRSDLVFHLCHLPLAKGRRGDFERISSEFGASLLFHDLTQAVDFAEAVAALPSEARLPSIIYGRLFLDRILPADVERIIYLDCDMMIKAPIETLWETELEGKAVGAAPDAWGPFFSIGRDMRENGDLYDPADPYFNSGLLLIDLKRWRRANLWEKLLTMTREGTMDRLYYDQGFLNIAFAGNVKFIDWRWNFPSPKPVHERMGIFGFHYTGYHKPWNLWANVAFFRLYRHVMTNDVYYRYWRERVRRRWSALLHLRPGKR